MKTCGMNKLNKPCASCPWRVDATAGDIPNFDITLAENLAATCPDERSMGPDFGASILPVTSRSQVKSSRARAGSPRSGIAIQACGSRSR